jgi:outer membrane lipoprotein carrier protein
MRGVIGALLVSAAGLMGIADSQRAGDQAPPSATELAREIQAHYDTVHDFRADFTHQYRGGVLHQTFNERGDVRVKKPGRMYWNYVAPEEKAFVSDGSKIYSYIKDDKVVYVSDMPSGDQVSTAVLFLAGRGDLVRDFRPSVSQPQPESSWKLDLTPKTPQADFTALTLTVDRRTFALQGLASTDPQGGTHTFGFTNLRENVGLSDNQFVFRIPKDAEVRR